jgi:hypothetical protein
MQLNVVVVGEAGKPPTGSASSCLSKEGFLIGGVGGSSEVAI